jgi:hypothetical protein
MAATESIVVIARVSMGTNDEFPQSYREMVCESVPEEPLDSQVNVKDVRVANGDVAST